MTRLVTSARRWTLAPTIAATAIAFAAGSTQPGITAFRANPQPVVAGTSTTYAWTLTGASEGAACTLDPGDGTPTLTIPNCANSPTIQHTYGTPGSYTATLDLQGADLNANASVTVVKHLPDDPNPGALLWKYQTHSTFQPYGSSSPTLGPDGSITFGSLDRHIYALNPNGTLKWKMPTPEWNGLSGEEASASGMPVAAPAIAPNGTIYVPVIGDGLYAINPNGTLQWQAPIHEVLNYPVAIARNGTIYVAPEHELQAYRPNGQLAWTYKGPDANFTLESTPAIGPNGTIYIGAEDYYIYAINPDGTLQWRYRTGNELEAGPAIGPHGTIYEGSTDHAFYALNPNGTLKWKFQTGRNFFAQAAIGPNGTIFIANNDGALYALNPNGTTKWQHSLEEIHYQPPIQHPILSTATIGNNGMLYIGSDDGDLYALHPDGTIAWSFHTSKPIGSAPAIAPNGILYVTSTNGVLYALHVTATGLAKSSWPTLQHDTHHTGRAP